MADFRRDNKLYVFPKSRCPEEERKENTCLPGLGYPYTIVSVITNHRSRPTPSASGRPSASPIYWILFIGIEDGAKAAQQITLTL